MQASSALISCVGSAIQTNLTIVFLLVAQHNSNKFDSALTPASVDSVFAPASVRQSLSKLNSAFDFVDFAIARHSSNKFDSALAYSQNYSLILIKLRKSLTRRFIRKLIKLRKSPFCFLLYRASVIRTPLFTKT